MKSTLTALILAAAFAIPSVWAAAADKQGIASAADNYQLEPCMNGFVSASGLYPTQGAEENSTASM